MLRPLAVALLLTLSACEPASQPVSSAAELADRMRARFASNVGAAEALAVTGAGIRATFASVADSAAAGFTPTYAFVDSLGADPEAAALLPAYLPNVPALASAIATGTFVGQRQRDGRAALIVSTADPALTGSPTDGIARSTRVFADPETFDILEIEQSARIDTLVQPIVRRFVYEDFREVEGVRLPFRLRQLDSGQDQQLSASDRSARQMVLGGQLAMAQQRAEALPAGPERDAAVARATRDMQNLQQGILEVVLEIDRVEVTRRAD